MSLHAGVVLIRGDHLGRLKEIYNDFGYGEVVRTVELRDARHIDAHVPPFPRDNTVVAACVANGWTLIFDLDLVLSVDEEACSAVSSRLGTRLFATVCEGVSNTYIFSLFDHGEKLRGFLSVDGKVEEDVGTPIPAEARVDLKNPFQDDILAVMRSLGAGLEDFHASKRIVLHELKYTLPVPELTPEEKAAFESKMRDLGDRLVLARGKGAYTKASRNDARERAPRKAGRWKFWRR